ncbi:MAG: hypothetical protein IJK02_04920 [Clostridia bacterium]|nr:hypothetical protein [Clostridia bacterium]
MKKTISVFLAALMLLTTLSVAAFAADKPVIGKVTVSFEDFGDRDYLLEYLDEDEMEYLTPFGVIFEPTEVTIYEGDTVADAIVRFFTENNVPYQSYGGTAYNAGFYLQAITFTADGETVENFGEGSITPDDEDMYYFSGWTFRLNDWCANNGPSGFYAEDGDVIRYMYTCTMGGSDVGNDFYRPSAKITGLEMDAAYGALTVNPDDEKAYTLNAPAGTTAVKLHATLENYGAKVTYTLDDGTAYKYMRDIPVKNGSVITVDSKYTTVDWNTGEETVADTDQVVVTVVIPEAPAEEEPGDADGGFFAKIRAFFQTVIDWFKALFAKIAAVFGK